MPAASRAPVAHPHECSLVPLPHPNRCMGLMPSNPADGKMPKWVAAGVGCCHGSHRRCSPGRLQLFMHAILSAASLMIEKLPDSNHPYDTRPQRAQQGGQAGPGQPFCQFQVN